MLNTVKLKQLAEEKKIYIGVAVNVDLLDKDKNYTNILANEFNIVTPENAMKWWATNPKPGKFTFEAADKLVSFAQQNNMAVRGHTLVWSRGLPEWMKAINDKKKFERNLKEYIKTVAGRYKGKIYAWDVVNEPLIDTGELEDNHFLRALGPRYIELALQLAHEADPDTKLFINEWGTDDINPKSNALYKLVKGLLANKVLLHGVGFQMHMSLGNCEWLQSVPSIKSVRKNLQRFSDLGLEVHITEMDILMKTGAGTLKERLKKQAEVYGEILQAALNVKNFKAFVVWGVNDKCSWLGPASKENDKPLLFDDKNNPKPAYFEIQKVLKG